MRAIGLVPGLVLLAAQTGPAGWPDSPCYWDTRRKGTNFFNKVESAERFKAAAATGIRLVRLAPDKWQGKDRDFLIGDADRFERLVPEDVAKLKGTLDAAEAAGVKVVLTMLSLPGNRWRQHNGDRSDFRLYRDPEFRRQAASFWRQLAAELEDHPAIAAYNIVNEPHPERSKDTADFDLNGFYRDVIAAIRESDPATAVVLDSGLWASPLAFHRLRPQTDPRVLYSFHFYEPWEYIDHRQKGRYRYPGNIPAEEEPGKPRRFDAAALESLVRPVVAWQEQYAVPATRIFAAEFGCPRTHPGAEAWLRDVVGFMDRRGWHWAFYSFREDTWDAMDYELGTRKLPWKYWQDIEAGRTPTVERKPNPLWRILTDALAGP